MTVNLFIDFFLLLCTKKILNIRVRLFRLILGAALGGVLSLAALLPVLPFGANLVLSAVTAALIVFVTFGRTNLIGFLKRVAVYFSVSFSFCGVMILLCTTLRPSGMGIYNNVVYFDISPVLLLILTLICYYILRLIKRFTKSPEAKQICTVEATLGGTDCFNAVIDTGCDIREPFSGDFAIIAEKEILHNLRVNDDKMRIIPFESLGGSGFLYGYKLEKLTIDGVQPPGGVYIGVCEGVLKGEVKALVPHELTKSR